MNKQVLLTGFALCSAMAVNAQAFKDGYVSMQPGSPDFASSLVTWQSKNYQYNDDDNFFISRVKPKERFRNAATQVRESLTEANDKHLIAWIPVGDPLNNGLPNGLYDSECFTMWSYVTHWGNWTASLGRIPGAFLDVAHKNGVGVSGVASVPWGGINALWSNAISAIANTDPALAAQYFKYNGIDGMGYNSEWSGGQTWLAKLRTFHENLVKISRAYNPIFENFWYDGTNDVGQISFDRGLGTHNQQTFGDGEHERTNLFFNYNWYDNQLSASVSNAQKLGRDPLDLYAGMNMQGAEGDRWTTLQNYPISIGLWGAHSNNMFWESRNEKGSADDTKQRTYMQRIERWFTGGTRNPVTTPAVINSLAYNADNFKFHGMSSFMTARSSLKWNLSDEPFITYFNIGNGKFFNWKGVRQTTREWYNVGVQDYLPTWHYWFASKLLGRTAADVPTTGLDADVTWDDAYMGGSATRIFGTSSDEYLHLFKTEFALQEGDVITLRYKVKKGKADMNLVLTAKGAEAQPINESDFKLLTTTQELDEDQWVERSYKVQGDLAGKDLALVALHFQNAADLDLYLGEFSIVRGSFPTPEKPELGKLTVLANNKQGVDAKLIFNMPNDKVAPEPCYNSDVNTSLFKLYVQQEGQQPQLVGATTSWAALYYSAPTNPNGADKMRFGVSALSMDQKTESEIAWTDYADNGTYTYDDDIQVNKTTIKPGEAFTMSYVDPRHEEGTWQVVDGSGKVVYEATGQSVTCTDGLPDIGSYAVKVTGPTYNSDGTAREVTTREYQGYVQITPESVGALPEIKTLTANGAEADLKVESGDQVEMAYTARHADGAASQGVLLDQKRWGVKLADLGLTSNKSFSFACWLKIDQLLGSNEETQMFAIADKTSSWPLTDWGWLWCNIDKTGKFKTFTVRQDGNAQPKAVSYNFSNTQLPIGGWVHLALVFDFNAQGQFHVDLYVNGVKQTAVDDPGYQTQPYQIRTGDVFSIAGPAFGRDAIDGAIDNFIYWDKAATADDVKAAMGDVDPNNLPAGVAAFWDLEQLPSSEYTYMSVGPKANVAAGLHEFYQAEGEGRGNFHWSESQVTSGCPFIAGSVYKVETLPTWKAKGATIAEATGNTDAGSAKLTYAKNGDYTVTLTLANALGSDSRTFSVITVGDPTGIGETTTGQTEAYVVGDQAYIDFAEAGNYSVRVYNVAGQLVASKAQQMAKGQKMTLTLAAAGTYVLDVQKDGKSVRTVKLIRQ